MQDVRALDLSRSSSEHPVRLLASAVLAAIAGVLLGAAVIVAHTVVGVVLLALVGVAR